MRQGFTVFEMMFVAGMILLLAAILVPTVKNAREDALDAECRSNLRQLALLCFDYSQSEGYFPWGMIEPSTHDETYCTGASANFLYPRERPDLHGVASWREYASFCWDFRRLASARGWQCGEMFGTWRADSVMCCPKCVQEQSDNWDGNRMTGYNYNVCFLGRVENDKGARMYPTRFDAVLHPERVVVFGDGGYSGGPNKFMRAPFQNKLYDNSSASLRKAGTQAFRHCFGAKRHCNMAFLDGHVEAFHQPYMAGGKPGWVDKRTHSAFISSGNGIYGPRGFGIADDDEPR